MIVTITLNPALDKTAALDNIKIHALNRLRDVKTDVGGKGINVSKTIHFLGKNTVACGFLAGDSGQIIENALRNYGIKTDFIFVNGSTRTNLKIVESKGQLTEFNELGPIVTNEDIEKLLDKLGTYAKPDTLFVFAGSACRGIDKNIYEKLIKSVKEKGAKAILDADGELFANGIKAKPDVVKPNVFELAQYFKVDESKNEKTIIDLGKRLVEKGIKTVWISRGSKGALFLNENIVIRIPGVETIVNSSVGAGDALVAAYAYGIDMKMPLNQKVRLAIATSVGAVMTTGTKPPSRELVESIMPKIQLQILYGKEDFELMEG